MGGRAGVEGTATLGFGKLIRVQESSELGERGWICIKPIYIMFFTNGAARRLWAGGEGEAVTCLHAGGGSSLGGGEGEGRDPRWGPPGLHPALFGLHPAAVFPQVPDSLSPHPALHHPAPQCSQGDF